MIVVALCFGLGQLRAELLSAAVESRREQEAITQVGETLTSDAALARHHRGFHGFVEAHPALALAERAHQELMLLPSFRSRVARFEEALRVDGAAPLFTNYYVALAEDAALRRAVEDLIRLEIREARRGSSFGDAVAYLKRLPGGAIEFLEHPARFVPTPEPLWPLRTRLRRDRDLQRALLEVFRELDRHPTALGAVHPWWAAAYGDRHEAGRAYRDLERYLLRFPARFWAWHRRNLAWTGYPDAVQWRDYWYARVRRTDVIETAYFTYLDILRREPGLANQSESGMYEAYGPLEKWPPDGTPPKPGPWSEAEEAIAEPARPDRPSPDRPARPSVDRPDIGRVPRPKSPERPARPNPEFGETPK